VTVLVLASLGSGQGQSAQKLDMEAGTAVVLTFMYGIGVVISLAYGDKSGQLEALMFGRLLDVTQSRLATSVTLCVIAALLILTTWRMQILVAFDTTAARAMGINVAAYELIANIAVGLIVVAASSAVGVLLVIGFIVIPGLSARLIAGSPRSMCFWAAGLSTLAVVVGFAIMLSQTTHQISPQAIVSLMLVATVPLAGLKGVFS
jgi:ABC superfamily ATP binding cassette transporter, permease protein